MAWNDEPTKAQLSAIYRFFQWKMSTQEARDAVKWLGEHADKREASEEMTRIRKLYLERKLDREQCFAAKIWDNCPIKLGRME